MAFKNERQWFTRPAMNETWNVFHLGQRGQVGFFALSGTVVSWTIFFGKRGPSASTKRRLVKRVLGT